MLIIRTYKKESKVCEMVALADCLEHIRGCVIPGTALSGPASADQPIGEETSVYVCVCMDMHA